MTHHPHEPPPFEGVSLTWLFLLSILVLLAGMALGSIIARATCG